VADGHLGDVADADRHPVVARDGPIFALAGAVTEVNRRRIGEVGVDGYLEKPVSWDALRRALASVPGAAR
jgi:CheY-like chemotaxis protein